MIKSIKYIFSLFLILSLFTNCSERISLSKELACNNFVSIEKSHIQSDFQTNFSIQIPANWKYKLYYDDYQSAIFMADTIKQLTDTFIIDISSKNGALKFNDSFEQLVSNKTDLTILKSNFEDYKTFPSYWNVSKGIKNNFPYHVFNMFIKTSETTYLEIKTEFYGEKLVDERLCKSLVIINTFEVLK